MNSTKISSALLAIPLLGLAGLPIHADDSRYCNDRFGFCLKIPAGFTADPPPDNGDGLRFHDGRGFQLTASGINNVLESTLEDEMRDAASGIDEVTYRKKAEGWYALSGYRGGAIVYIKRWVGSGAINGIQMEYPTASKALYDETVKEIVNSFQPGPLAEPR